MSREPALLWCRLALGSALTLFSLTAWAEEPAAQKSTVRIGGGSSAAGVAVADDESPAEDAAPETGDSEAAAAPEAGPPPKLVPIPEPKGEVITERHPNRAVRIERHVAQDAEGNYFNHGSWSNWDEKGVLRGTGSYREGLKQGKWIRWFNAGEGKLFASPFYKQFQAPFVAEANFVDDKLEGKWIILDSKGRTASEWEFSRDQLHGLSVWYFPSGHTQREVPYQNGQIEGEVREWAFTAPAQSAAGRAQPAHTLTGAHTYSNGQRRSPHVELYASGRKRLEGTYLSPRETLKTEHDFWNGALQTSVANKDAGKQRCGVWTWYYPDGGKQLEGEFNGDEPIGLHSWWFPNGQRKTEGIFENGAEAGQWTWWHANGQKHMEGQYAGGTQTGRWTRWNDLGKVIESQEVDTSDIRGEEDPGIVAEIEASQPATRGQPVPFRVQTARPRSGTLRR